MAGNDVADIAFAQSMTAQQDSLLEELERRRTKPPEPSPLPAHLTEPPAPLKPDEAAGPQSGPQRSIDEIKKSARAEWESQQDQSVIDDANADANARTKISGLEGIEKLDNVPGPVKAAAFALNDIGEAVVELFPHNKSITNIGKAPLRQEKAEWHAGNVVGALSGFTNSILALNDAVWEWRTGETLEDGQKFRVPDPGPTDTITGNLSRGIGQFLIGFKGADKMLGPALAGLDKGGKVAQFGSITVKSAFADFLAFDPEEGRLADMLMQIPDDHALAPIKAIVPEFLVSDEDDGQFWGRLKNVAEGGMIGGVLDSIYLAVTAVKRTKEAQKAVEDTVDALEAEEAGVASADEEFMAVFDEYMPGFRDRPDDEPGPEAFEFDEVIEETAEETPALDALAEKFDDFDVEEAARGIEEEADRLAANESVARQADDEVSLEELAEAEAGRTEPEQTAAVRPDDDVDVQAEAIIARAEEDPEVYDIIADEIDETPEAVGRALDELFNGEPSELGQRVLDAYRAIEADDAVLRADALDKSEVSGAGQALREVFVDSGSFRARLDEINSKDELRQVYRDLYGRDIAEYEKTAAQMRARIERDRRRFVNLHIDNGSPEMRPWLSADADDTAPRFAKRDPQPFTTTAELALDNPPPRFRDAKALTADQWRNYFRDAGATKEAFEFQIEPVLRTIQADEAGRIPKEALADAIQNARPDVKVVSEKAVGTFGASFDWMPQALRNRLGIFLQNFGDNLSSGYDGVRETVGVRAGRLGAIIEGGDDGEVAFDQFGGDNLKGRVETDYSEYVSPGDHKNYEQEIVVMPNEAKGYKSHNWDTEGTVGHIRTTERTLPDGTKALHADEVQSDLNQEAAKYGRSDDPVPSILQLEILEQAVALNRARLMHYASSKNIELDRDNSARWLVPFKDDPTGKELAREAKHADEAFREAVASGKSVGAVPNAPLKNWERPFIRRVLEKAVSKGIDTVTFTSYDTLHDALKHDGTRKFYDQRMPAHLRKEAKRLGAKLERVTFDANGNKVYAFRLNPEAKAKLAEGNPMFAKRGAASPIIEEAKLRVVARRQLRLSAMRALGHEDYIALEDAGRISYADTGTIIDRDKPTVFRMRDQLAVTMPDGRMIINSSVARPEEIPGLMLHEMGIHSGLKEFLGGDREYDAIMRALDDALDGRDADVAIARQRAMDELEGNTFLQGRQFEEAANQRALRGLDPNDSLTMATFRGQTRSNDPSHVKEEILAYLVQFAPDNTLVQRIVGTMKAHIAKRFPGITDRLRWTESDFRQLAILSLKAQARKARGMPFRYRENAQADGTDISTQLMVEGDGRGPLGAPRPSPVLLEDVVQPIRLKELNALPATAREMEKQLRSGYVMEAVAVKHGGEALFEYGDLLDAAIDGMMTQTQAMRLKQLLAPLEDMDLPISVKTARGEYEPWTFSDDLTDARNTIVKLLREGRTYSEVADMMDMTPAALSVHVSQIRKKLPSAIPAKMGWDRGEQERWLVDLATRNKAEKLGLTNDMIAQRASAVFGKTITLNTVKATLSRARRKLRTEGHVPKFSRRGPGDPVDDTFDPYASPLPYLNLDRIKGPDDLKREIERLAALSADEVQRRVGPPRTFRQVEAQAAHANAFDALLKSRGGHILDPAQALALRQLRDASAERLMSFAKRYTASPTPQGKLALQNARLLHIAIQAEVSGQSAAAARALGSLRILSGPTAQARRQLESAVARLGDEGNFDQLARQIARLGEGQQRELDRLVRYSVRDNVADASGAWFRAMILSAPITHTVNFAGNSAMILFDIMSHFTSGALARVAGNPEGAEMMMQAVLKGQGVLEGLMHQFRYAKKNSQLVPLKKDFGLKFDDMGVSGRQVDAADRRAITADRYGLDEESVLGKATEMIGAGLAAPSGALGVADDFFKGVNYMGELKALAHRRASNELRSGHITRDQFEQRIQELMEEPTQSMISAANRAAKERTFTTDPGPALMRALGIRRWMNGLGLPVGHYILPFVITPANIMSYTFKSLPFTNVMFAEVREQLARGGQDAWRVRGQIAMGTATVGLAWSLASQGIVTGGGPSDQNKRRAMQENQGLGWSPYTVRLGGQSYQYDRFDPIGNLFAFGAELAEITSNRDLSSDPDDELLTLIAAGSLRAGKSMLDKSYLTGVRDWMAAFTDPDRADDTFLQKLVTANVAPSGGAAIRRVQDPFWRETHNTVDAIKNRLPFGQSKHLPKEYDMLGRPKTYQSGLGAVYDSFVPFISRRIDPEPIDSEMMRLGYWPSFLDRSITVRYAGQSVNVSLKHQPEIYSRMSELIGGDKELGLPSVISLLNARVKSRGYQSMMDGPTPLRGSKAAAIQDIINDQRQRARKIVQQEFGVELRQLAKRQLERQLEFAAQQDQSEGPDMAQQLLEQLQSQ